MPADFLDTSALAKHYHPEVGSAEIDRLWDDAAQGLFVSRLSVLEIVSVFAGKVRAGAISVADFETLRRRFTADLTKRKRLSATRLLVAHFQERSGCCVNMVRRSGCARSTRYSWPLRSICIERKRSTASFRPTGICLRWRPLRG